MPCSVEFKVQIKMFSFEDFEREAECVCCHCSVYFFTIFPCFRVENEY